MEWDITAPEGDLIMEWLTTNWIWLVLGLGIAWFFFRGGMRCGTGGHGSHGTHGAQRSNGIGPSHNGHPGDGAPDQEGGAPSARSRHRGC